MDLTRVVGAVEAALPKAAPFAVAPMLRAQLPYLDERVGRTLLDQITACIPASAWGFVDAVLDSWPDGVAEHALASIRALPVGTTRIHALCNVTRRLNIAERREVLDGILDGTLPETTYEHTKPLSYRGLIVGFVRDLPEAGQEEWIATKVTLLSEWLARRDLGRLTEAALRKMWSQIDHASKPTEIPSDYLGIAQHLPCDLKVLALARIRKCQRQSSRLCHLAPFDTELTDAERYEVVDIPWNEHTRDDPRIQADHLRRIAHHLSKVPTERRQRWLHRVLSFASDYDLQHGLMALLPSLSGLDHRQSVDALVASVIREGRFYTSETCWSLLPDGALGPLLMRLRDDEYGWSRDEIISHLVAERAPDLADRCLLPLIEGLGELEADHCLEAVCAMTPWLADRSMNAVPQALATLPVPIPERGANPLYVIDRVLRSHRGRAARATGLWDAR